MSDHKRWTAARGLGAALCMVFLAACGKLVDVNVTVVDQKTALENQILGSYEELGDEMLLLMFTEMGAPGYIKVLEERLGDLQSA